MTDSRDEKAASEAAYTLDLLAVFGWLVYLAVQLGEWLWRQ